MDRTPEHYQDSDEKLVEEVLAEAHERWRVKAAERGEARVKELRDLFEAMEFDKPFDPNTYTQALARIVSEAILNNQADEFTLHNAEVCIDIREFLRATQQVTD